MAESNIKTFKSQTYVTPPVRAVWPHLNEVDKFGSFSVDIDSFQGANAEIVATIEEQYAQTLKQAQAKLGTDKMPTNSIRRSGEYLGEAFERIGFKMKGTKTVKGKEIKQSPTLVDTQKNKVEELIYSGSLVKIAYQIQYTLMPTGTYQSLKLRGVQVIQPVNADGELPVEESFGIEEGYVAPSAAPPSEFDTPAVEDVAHEVASSGQDF